LNLSLIIFEIPAKREAKTLMRVLKPLKQRAETVVSAGGVGQSHHKF
jgi:hypothetical protein